MNPQLVLEFVDDTMQFFENYHGLLSHRIDNIFHHEDIEETGQINFWITQIVNANVERIIEQLKRFRKIIPISPVIETYTYIDLYNTLTGRRSPRADEQNTSEEENKELATIVKRTIDYLLRAQEMLKLQAVETDYYAYYIPTTYFLEQKKFTEKALAQCLKISDKYKVLIPSNCEQKKSWLTRELRLGIIMSQIQRVAFGLVDNLIRYFGEHDLDTSKIQPDHQKTAVQALKVIVQKIDEFPTLIKPSGKTRKFLGCEDAESMPTNQMHFEYFPSEIPNSINNVKKLIESNVEINATEVLKNARKPRIVK